MLLPEHVVHAGERDSRRHGALAEDLRSGAGEVDDQLAEALAAGAGSALAALARTPQAGELLVSGRHSWPVLGRLRGRALFVLHDGGARRAHYAADLHTSPALVLRGSVRLVAAAATRSSAYNLDYTYASWRACYEGVYTWLNTVERGRDYSAGDVWGCVGLWFSGRWYLNNDTYLNQPGDSVHWHFDNRTWLTPTFING